MKTKSLTKRQKQVYEFMKDSFQANHRLPTAKDISIEFKFSSPNAAYELITYIYKKGFLTKIPTGEKSCVYKFAKFDAQLIEKGEGE